MIDLLDESIEVEFTTMENGDNDSLISKEYLLVLPNRASLLALIDSAEDALEKLDSSG